MGRTRHRATISFVFELDESVSYHASALATVGYEGRVCWGSELYSLSRAACEPTSVSVSTERKVVQMDVVWVCHGRDEVIDTRSIDTGVNSALMRAQKTGVRGTRDGL